jgi:hypothetical protein
VDEYLALAALAAIGARYSRRQTPLSLEELARIFPSSNNLAARVAGLLQDCRLVVQVAATGLENSPRYVPSLPLDQITVQEVLDCLRRIRGEVLAQALEEEPELAAGLKALVASAPSPPWQSLSLQELVDRWFKGRESLQNPT